MTALPPYVINGNLYDALAPVQLTDVVMHNFCVPADPVKLQAWLDRNFSAPSGGKVRYRLLGDKVFLSFAQIGKLWNIETGQPIKGYTSEIDITIWILTQREDDGLFALRWIPAYLFVDSGPALVSGREIWGFPKQLGRFDFSPQNPDPSGERSFSADGFVVSPYGPESPARWATMFEARPIPITAEPGRGSILGSLEGLAKVAVTRLTDGLTTIAGKLSTAMSGGGMTMALLKQFPDAATPTLACYQAIVETHATITNFIGGGLTIHDYEVRITSFDSHPYFDELGISSDWQNVGQAVWMNFDFQQALGTIVWSSGA